MLELILREKMDDLPAEITMKYVHYNDHCAHKEKLKRVHRELLLKTKRIHELLADEDCSDEYYSQGVVVNTTWNGRYVVIINIKENIPDF